MVGMMLHQDASTHAWLAGDARKYDLVVTMEDATSALYSAFLVDEEGTASSFPGLREVVDKARPVLLALHATAAAITSLRPRLAARSRRRLLTQVGRALSSLASSISPAYSPQARGRSERVFRHPAGSVAEGAQAGRDRHGRGGQYAGCGTALLLTTTRGLRSRRSRRDRRSWPIAPGHGGRSCACTKIVRWAATTR